MVNYQLFLIYSMKSLLVITLSLFATVSSLADVRLPKILSSNMVLQREKPISLWGWADAGEKITVQFNKQTKNTKADKSGKWLVALDPESAGGPYTLTVKGKNAITLSNILVGEVWVCSGQSNMEWPVRAVTNAEAETKNGSYPEIRHFTVQKSVASKPEEEVKGGEWEAASPETVGDFTAVGFFFAREVYNKLKIPVGLIHTSWGGTHSETWTSRQAFEQSEEFKSMIASMPQLDLEELARQKNELIRKKLVDLHVTLPTGNEFTAWKEAGFDDKSWPTMKIPQLWENSLGELDGTLWLRTSFALSADEAGKTAIIDLSMIDDNDETFVNGVKVGGINSYNTKRSYNIPASLLKEGKNVIAVKVVDTGGGGGIYGEAKDVRVTTQSGKVIPLAGDWSFQVESLLGTASVNPNSYPTLLFNAMLNPILNYSIRGALWYQGESNAGRAYQYRKAFPLMIQDWRTHFRQGDFPFYFVQLASFNSNNGNSEKGSNWAELREAQTMTLSLPNTGMAVTTDIGEANDIHPRNKQDVGKRLAALALNRLYNQAMTDSGPMYKSMKVVGNQIRISFTNASNGLLVKDKYGYLKGFEVADRNEKFHYAKAWIEGNEVVVSCEAVSWPAEVRYAWADNPEDANLFNKEGFPAVPFRSDNWKGITEVNKFQID
jgi:sialate O-acetylesterase